MEAENKGTGVELFNREAVIELIVSGNWIQEKLADALKPYNVSIAQFNVLRILRGQKGEPASLACVNEKMIHKMSNTTRLVDKLLEKDLVKRITCPNNRRKVEITITSAGLELLKELDKVVYLAEEKLMKNLDQKQISMLIDLLKQLKS